MLYMTLNINTYTIKYAVNIHMGCRPSTVKQTEIFAPQLKVWNHRERGLLLTVAGVLLTDEGFWQDQRRFVLRHLREFGFGRRTMAELVEEEAEQLVKAFQQKLDGSQVGKVVTIFARRYIFCVWNTDHMLTITNMEKLNNCDVIVKFNWHWVCTYENHTQE